MSTVPELVLGETLAAVPAPRRPHVIHCTHCLEAGHNKRGCDKLHVAEDAVPSPSRSTRRPRLERRPANGAYIGTCTVREIAPGMDREALRAHAEAQCVAGRIWLLGPLRVRITKATGSVRFRILEAFGAVTKEVPRRWPRKNFLKSARPEESVTQHGGM